MPGVCPRCNREVYFAEERLALGKVWHAFCFSCRNCRKLLDSSSVATHCGELFCKNCYVRLFPPNANHEIKTILRFSPPTSIPISIRDVSNRCCYRIENRIGDISLNRKQNHQSGKCRLRGGGSEEEEANVLFEEGKKRSLEGECTNIGTVDSISTICDPPPSPSAVTTWYNRQHSKLRSTRTSKWQSNSAVKVSTVKNEKLMVRGPNVHHCQSEEQQQENPSESNLEFVGLDCDHETNVTKIQVSADRNRATSTDCDKRIATNRPVDKSRTDNTTIPSRQKFAYPPIPPRRSPLPSRRRVSFCDVVFGDRCGNDRNRNAKMQDNHCRSCRNNDCDEEHNTSYDIWRADDPAGKSDGGYENTFNASQIEDPGRMQFAKGVTDCCDSTEDTFKQYDDVDKNSGRDHNPENPAELRTSRAMNVKDTDNTASEENVSCVHKNVQNSSNEFDSERMRGGCGGSRVHPNPCDYCARNNDCDYMNSRPSTMCSQGRSLEERYDYCSSREPDPCRDTAASCTACSPPCIDRRGYCPSANDRLVCKKTVIRCRRPCTGEPQACGAGGCCGSGCRGGCGKPGQTCMPSRPCTTPPCRPHSPSVGSPCSPPRSCTPQPPCCRARKVSIDASAVVGECGGCGGGKSCGNCCGSGGGTSYCRSRSPRCRASRGKGCCSNDGARSTDGACCRPKPPGCECLGGGLDCQRCGRKVYQAEMQIASGVPYHNICFSCFCCRKPLEPLTYQENCGEIYCKQCYVRNFGPQGYGYGVGAGALQTPM